jgi:hypothetical protein
MSRFRTASAGILIVGALAAAGCGPATGREEFIDACVATGPSKDQCDRAADTLAGDHEYKDQQFFEAADDLKNDKPSETVRDAIRAAQ